MCRDHHQLLAGLKRKRTTGELPRLEIVAHRKHRNTVGWLIAGLVASFVALLLILIAPPGGQPWGKRAYLAAAIFGLIALVIVLFFVALSKANFTY